MTTVLVVEDDPYLRRVFKTILKNEGYDVREAADGLEGLAEAEANPPACIIADAMMPRLDGLTMLRRLREGGMAVPAIVVSALHDLPSKEDLGSLGVVRVFGKPFVFDQLIEAVRKAVEPLSR